MKNNLIEIYNLLNQIELKGVQNISNMFRSLAILENLITNLQKEEQVQEEIIKIDNTKKEDKKIM